MSDRLFGFGNANTKGLFKCKGCEDLKKYIDEQHSHMDELTKIYDELIGKINKLTEEKRKLKEELLKHCYCEHGIIHECKTCNLLKELSEGK